MEEENDEFHDCHEGPLSPSQVSEVTATENTPKSIPDNVFQFHQFEEDINSLQHEDEENLDSPTVEEISEIPKEIANDVDIEKIITPKDINKSIESKEKGNEYFRNKDYDNAIQLYSLAIDYCPEEEEYKEQLATFYGNRSAAYKAEEEWELVIEDCTAALELKPDYVKVIVRRMECYDKLEKYEEALTDAKKVQELDPSYPKISVIVARLQRLYNEKMEKLKDEAMGKLKELGNSILGNFGMSLDNFKMAQDPNTGSWSVGYNNGK